MKYLMIAIALCSVLVTTSCTSTKKISENINTEVAGFTTKSKKEIMQQKVLHKKSKTVIALP